MRKELKSFITRRILWSVLIALLLSVAAIILIGDRVKAEAEEVKKKNNIIESYKSKDQVLDRLKSDYEIIEGEYDQFMNLFPSEDNLIDFVKEIEKIAELSGNNQTIAISDKVVEERDFKVLPIVINLEGSYDQLEEYLVMLENLAYFTQIDVIEYITEEKDGKLNTIIKIKLIVR